MIGLLVVWVIVVIQFLMFWNYHGKWRREMRLRQMVENELHKRADREQAAIFQANWLRTTLRNLDTTPSTEQLSAELSRVHEAWAVDQDVWHGRLREARGWST